jgi:cytochrome b561
MMIGNTDRSWGSLSKSLHWGIALLIAFEVPLGFIMTATYAPSLRDDEVRALHVVLNQAHYTIGFAVLMLVALRVIWRLRHPVPHAATDQPRWQRRLAFGNHWALYLLLFLLPLSGWAALSVLGDTEAYGDTPIWLFGWDIIPSLLAQRSLEDPLGYGTFALIHRYAIYLGGALLCLHILAALYHHLVRRDGLLWRMWPGANGGELDRTQVHQQRSL